MANGAGFHLLVFGVLCGVYAFKYGCVDVGVQAILKAVPIWYLAFALARGVTERHCGRSCPKAESLGFYATQGLLLSSIGDLFLEQMAIAERLGVPEDLLFVLGLGAFLIAHLLYVVASTAHTEPSDKSHTATVSLLGTYCAAFVSMLWPNVSTAHPGAIPKPEASRPNPNPNAARQAAAASRCGLRRGASVHGLLRDATAHVA